MCRAEDSKDKQNQWRLFRARVWWSSERRPVRNWLLLCVRGWVRDGAGQEQADVLALVAVISPYDQDKADMGGLVSDWIRGGPDSGPQQEKRG